MLHWFIELISLELHICCQYPIGFERSYESLLLCPTARQKSKSESDLSDICRHCLQDHWIVAAAAACDVCRFIGLCGVVNVCIGFELSGARLVLLASEASTPCNAQLLVMKHVNRRFHDNSESWLMSSDRATDARFERAEALLQMILHSLREAFYARMAEADLHQARLKVQHAVSDHFEGKKRLLQGVESGDSAPTSDEPERRSQQVVRLMLDYLHHHYQHPMALRELAIDLKMNANYLSDLFSKTMGITFHRYLEKLRMVKAEQLLSDPCARIADVAYAVGYSNPNHFCSVFKIHEGISPSAWRGALRSVSREPLV